MKFVSTWKRFVSHRTRHGVAVVGMISALALASCAEKKEFMITLAAPAELTQKIGGPSIVIPVKITNKGGATISETKSDRLSYHLLSAKGDTLVHDGKRTTLPDIAAGETKEVPMVVEAPKAPGEYLVEVDLVREIVTWYKDKGNLAPRVKLTVKP